jgi:DNA-binding CsgD family transcriptional regulator
VRSRRQWPARGDLVAAREALRSMAAALDEDAPGIFVEMLAWAAALIHEAEDDDEGAFALLGRFWEMDIRDGVYGLHRWLGPPLVRLAMALGRPGSARRVCESTDAAGELASEVPSIRALALRCRGLCDTDGDLLLEAVGLARSSGRVLDLAGSCEGAAGVLRRVGRTAEAKALLTEASELYEGLGAVAWVARVNAQLRQLGVRPGTRGARSRPTTGWKSLTDKEIAIAERVSEGLTNREVARRLHISPHTVNTHLRHVFTKLGVSSRAALAAAVAEKRRAMVRRITQLMDVFRTGFRAQWTGDTHPLTIGKDSRMPAVHFPYRCSRGRPSSTVR